MHNEKVYIASMSKAVKAAKKLGKFNPKRVLMYGMVADLVEFMTNVQQLGNTVFDEDIVEFKRCLDKLQNSTKDLCNYKVIVADNSNINETQNLPPVVLNQSEDLEENLSYTFILDDFIAGFSDPNGDSYKNLIINPGANVNGELRYNNIIIDSPITINISGLSQLSTIGLTYVRTTNDIFTEDFTFRISDNNTNFLYSNLATFTMFSNVVADTGNLPPNDIGDNTIYVPNRAETILTLTMFTAGLTPPYNDPENDLIDAIKIVDISNANRGQYLLGGIPITVGTIITREQILNNEFTHVAPDEDAIASDVFEFEARDEGSGIWIG